MTTSDHSLIEVTVDGNGPATGSDFDHWACSCGDSDCKKGLENLDPYAKPSDSISDAQFVFPASLGSLLPPMSMIPDEFRMNGDNEWVSFVHDWFFEGFPESGVIPRADIDAELAHRHLYTLLRSYEPKHEHKVAAVAWLASRWWDGIVPAEKQS